MWLQHNRRGSYRRYIGNAWDRTDFTIVLVNLIMNQIENPSDKVRFEVTGFLYNDAKRNN